MELRASYPELETDRDNRGSYLFWRDQEDEVLAVGFYDPRDTQSCQVRIGTREFTGIEARGLIMQFRGSVSRR